MTVRIHRAALPDVDHAAPLFAAYRAFYGRAHDVDAARAFLVDRLARDESVVLLAMLDEDAVGFTQCYRTFSSVSLGRVLVLNDLYVAPSARRRGVACALIDAATTVAESENAIAVTLCTQRTNAAARTLYRAIGFVEDEEFVYLSRVVTAARRSSG